MVSLQRVRACVGSTIAAFAITLAAALAAPTAGRAAVTYSFQWTEAPGPGDRSSAFTLVVPRFITGARTAGVDQLASCSTRETGATCQSAAFYTDASRFTSRPRDAILFSVSLGPSASEAWVFYFADGAFLTPGVHQDQRSGIVAQLTVSGAADVVPEPSAWALMLLGFGAVGAALRRPRARLSA